MHFFLSPIPTHPSLGGPTYFLELASETTRFRSFTWRIRGAQSSKRIHYAFWRRLLCGIFCFFFFLLGNKVEAKTRSFIDEKGKGTHMNDRGLMGTRGPRRPLKFWRKVRIAKGLRGFHTDPERDVKGLGNWTSCLPYSPKLTCQAKDDR